MPFKRSGDSKEGLVPDTAGSTSGPSSTDVKKDAFLGRGTKVVGSLSFAASAEIEGYIEGEITAQDRLIIGESAVINAKISGSEIVIRGTVTGDISARSRLYLQKPAKVVGNVKCSSLGIEEGVAFEGKCTMESGAADTRPNNPQSEKPTGNKSLP